MPGDSCDDGVSIFSFERRQRPIERFGRAAAEQHPARQHPMARGDLVRWGVAKCGGPKIQSFALKSAAKLAEVMERSEVGAGAGQL